MIRLLLLASLVFLTHIEIFSQKLSGQWTGGFTSSSDPYGGKTDYVLELEINNNTVSGYSYTYFNAGRTRYYTICRLSGSFDKGSKSILVKEVEKVKGNTPPDFRDCFQSHSLTYLKADGKEILSGRWKPASDKENCGSGKTELERKALVKVYPQKDQQQKNTTNNSIVKNGPKKNKVAKSEHKSVESKNNLVPFQKSSPIVSTDKSNTIKSKDSIHNKLNDKQSAEEKLIKRTKQVIKSIDVEAKSFRVELYDNGQIDGDTVSLFLNNRLIIAKQRLSKSPISLTIDLDENKEQELVLYAENLGTVPPNTALMVVIVGEKRYEIDITTTELTNAAIRFVRK